MSVRRPVPVISACALAVLLGLGLGASLGGVDEPAAGELGGQGVGGGTESVHPQDEVDGPPMDYRAAESSSSSAARASQSAVATTRSSATATEPSPAPTPPTAESTSLRDVLVLGSTPALPSLPSAVAP